FSLAYHREVWPQVVIEIAGAKNGAGGPIGLLAGNQSSPALFFQEQRRPFLAARDHIHNLVPVPILHHYRLGVVKRGRYPRCAGDIGEKQRAELAIDTHCPSLPHPRSLPNPPTALGMGKSWRGGSCHRY